jgi:hypothetical protein
MRKKDMEAAFKLMGVEVVVMDQFIAVYFIDGDGVQYITKSEHRTNQSVFDAVVFMLELNRRN